MQICKRIYYFSILRYFCFDRSPLRFILFPIAQSTMIQIIICYGYSGRKVERIFRKLNNFPANTRIKYIKYVMGYPQCGILMCFKLVGRRPVGRATRPNYSRDRVRVLINTYMSLTHQGARQAIGHLFCE